MFDNLQRSRTYAQRVQRAFTSAQNPLCCRPLLLHLTHLGYVAGASDTAVFWSWVWRLRLRHSTLLHRDRPSNHNRSLQLFTVLLVVDNPISVPGSLSETTFKLRYHTAFAPLVACRLAAFNLATFTLDEHSR